MVWNEALSEIHLQLMGEVQLEVLMYLIEERFGVHVTFDTGHIVYKEMIAAPVIGIGHFEPLRHYAEVHILMEPLARGSGIQYASMCDTDTLDLNWQRLILTHLMEKRHVGVLTGSVLTDVKYTLLTGRAHVKHTEGGDFRQATYRAVRQGLMQAESVLLEPWYEFCLEVPQENLGRAMNDIQRMGGVFENPEFSDETCCFSRFSKCCGNTGILDRSGSLHQGKRASLCTLKGYEACHNAEELIAEIGYDAERDTENSADSIFCTHGAGRTVSWQKVAENAHCDSGMFRKREQSTCAVSRSGGGSVMGDKELEEIFVRTYGPIKNRGMDALSQSRNISVRPTLDDVHYIHKDDVLIVDGYNMIFAWDDLKRIAAENLDASPHGIDSYTLQLSGNQKMPCCISV